MRSGLFGILILVTLITQAFALPLNSMSLTITRNGGYAGDITRVHGFHCRPMVGWDASVGYYRRHTHPGICANYQGCMKQQQRCIFTLGRGWDVWKYEKWGFDNWRYTSCMIEAGCY